MKLRIATHDELKKYMNKANLWLNTVKIQSIFMAYKNVAMLSVAEFLANQDGITLYEINARDFEAEV